ncbi:MAG: GNAT family N-acetyltransferase [Deltaproteobacteria bacterium]|nr:GNAT family N-acetyltransferase [Deltaproteobacteria bacterium]
MTDIKKVIDTNLFHHHFKDRRNKDVIICYLTEEHLEKVKEMYDSFEPKECAQGLPFEEEEKRHKWLKNLLKNEYNLIALIDNKVVGHACLINIEKGKTAEYLVFVHQDHQNCGIGTELTKYIKELAKRLSYQKIWLTVSAFNSCAISVYKKAGFHFVGPRDSDREMVVEIYKNQIK